MKTPLETARYTFDKMHSRAAEVCENEILYMIESAIESDRAQRDLYELIAEALDERHEMLGGKQATKAASALRGEGGYIDTIWDCFIGPMLDQLERVYGE